MGIHGLMKLIGDYAPSAMKDVEIKTCFGTVRGAYFGRWALSRCISHVGRKVAVDASMSLYQFLIAVRMEGSQLTDADGETTRYTLCVCVCVCVCWGGGGYMRYACVCVYVMI